MSRHHFEEQRLQKKQTGFHASSQNMNIVNTGFQALLHEKLGLKFGLFSQKFRAFVNEK